MMYYSWSAYIAQSGTVTDVTTWKSLRKYCYTSFMSVKPLNDTLIDNLKYILVSTFSRDTFWNLKHSWFHDSYHWQIVPYLRWFVQGSLLPPYPICLLIFGLWETKFSPKFAFRILICCQTGGSNLWTFRWPEGSFGGSWYELDY